MPGQALGLPEINIQLSKIRREADKSASYEQLAHPFDESRAGYSSAVTAGSPVFKTPHSRRSARQKVLEEARHRHLVFIIGAHFGGVLRARKAVRGAAVEVDFEVHLGGAELRDHRIELVHGGHRIFGAVQD